MDWGHRGRDKIVVGFAHVISASHHYSCEFESITWQGVLDTTVYDKVCQPLVAGQVCDFKCLGILVSSTNKTDLYEITEILLKVALNTITLTLTLL